MGLFLSFLTCSIGLYFWFCVASEPQGAAGKGPAEATKFLPIPSLGVQLEMPADAEAHPGTYSVMIWGNKSAACKVILSDRTKLPQPFESAVRDAERSTMGGAIKAWAKKEKRPDGWALEWTFTSGLDKKDQWGVDYSKMIDGKRLSCGSNVDSAEAGACIARACASLKKL